MENNFLTRLRLVTPALLAILLWASLATLGTRLAEVPAFFLLGMGFLIGSLCGLRDWRQWKVSTSQLALGLYGLFGYHFCLFMALRIGPVLEANLLNYLWPLLVVLLAPLFFPNLKITKRAVVAACLGFTGAALIVTNGRFELNMDQGISGFLFAIGAAFIWSTYTLLCRKNPFPSGAIGLFCLLSGILSLICHSWLEPSYVPTSQQMIFVLLLGLGPMGAAFFLWDRAIKKADPRLLGGISYLTPLLSTVFLISFGMGSLSFISALAIVLILVSSILSLM